MKRWMLCILCVIMLGFSGCGTPKEEIEENIVYKLEKCSAPVFSNAKGRNWDIGSAFSDGIYARMYMKNYFGNDEELSEFVYYIDRLNINTMETVSFSYTAKKGELRPYSIDCTETATYGLFEKMDENFLVNEVQIIAMNADGALGSSVDITAFLQEFDLLPKEAHFPFQGSFHVNEAEREVYMVPIDESGIYIFAMDGSDGKKITSAAQGNIAHCKLIWGDAGCIFSEYDRAADKTIFSKYTDGKMIVLFSQPGDCMWDGLEPFYSDSNGTIIYLENQTDLVSLNLSTGVKELLIPEVSDRKTSLSLAARMAEGKVMVLRNNRDGLSSNLYSQDGPAENIEITIEVVGTWDNEIVEKFRRFEQTHPGVTIRRGTDIQADDIKLNKIYTDIAAGNGPDCVYLYRWDAEKLVDRNVLLDIYEVGEEEPLLAKILETGKYDGKQYFFPTNFFAETIVLKNSVWDKPTWTVEEVLNLLDAHQTDGDIFLLGEEFDSFEALLSFFLYDLKNSPFIDLETMTADFDSALFMRVLECCKEQADQSKNENRPEAMQGLRDGKQLANVVYPTFGFFSQTAEELEEDYNYVGFPTDGKSGNLGVGNVGLVVNRNTAHGETIQELLQYLYSYDCCSNSVINIPFRTDILKEAVVINPAWSSNPGVFLKVDYHGYTRIPGAKKNGDSFMDEYIAFLNSIEPKDERFDTLKSIISEEAAYYYSGAKTIEEVMRVIQNRASLFLSEMG